MVDEQRQNSKLKLDQLWKDLNDNLPAIEFDETQDDNSTQDDPIDERDNQLNELNFELDNNEIDDDWDVIIDKRDQQTSEFPVTGNQINGERLKKQLITTNEKQSSPSAKTAALITKNIFNDQNKKLSMEIFEKINIDEILDSTNFNENVNTTATKTPSTSRRMINNDEAIMKKLADMSMNMSKDCDLSSVDLRTGAIASASTSGPSFLPFKSVASSKANGEERTENATTRANNMAYNVPDENAIKSELDEYLKTHHKVDGNSTQTRRIDLRASQNMNTANRVYSKPRIEQLFDKLARDLFDKGNASLSLTKPADNTNESKNKTNGRIKFLNENSSSSSDSSSDSDDLDSTTGNDLWIERYRRHKNTFK